MATATKTKPSSRTTRRQTVSFDQLRELTSRRRKSSYPVDARTERLYWLKQIEMLLGE